MARRIHNLAKELGIRSQAIIDKCIAEGIPEERVPNHMAIVTKGLEATIREWFGAPSASTQPQRLRSVRFDKYTAVQAPDITLMLTAAPKELASLLVAWPDAAALAPPIDWIPVHVGDGLHLARSGVGKVNAALALTQLLNLQPFTTIVNIGLCGALPNPAVQLNIGDIVIATSSIYADEGLASPTGFTDLSGMGFPIGGDEFSGCSIAPDPDLLARFTAAFGDDAKLGPIATVSTCSGTDPLVREVVKRTGAIAEAMEGAAVAHAAARLARSQLRFIEVRVVSNTTGDRDKQKWDLPTAFSRLTQAASIIKGCLA